jgi:hypothetical protein
MQSPRELPFMHTSFIPEREFNAIANANLVVNHAEVIPNDMRVDSQLLSHVAVREPFCHQLYNGLLSGARPSVLISKEHGFLRPVYQGLLIFFITRMPTHDTATIKISMRMRVTCQRYRHAKRLSNTEGHVFKILHECCPVDEIRP